DRFEAFKFGKADTATLTMRYSRLITPDCIIIKIDDKFKYDCYSGETEQWEIEDADDVENRHAWLEIFVKRWEKAK
ncbi:MAG: hypothetical protein FWF15_12375, partial [Oscillospiraceae bacterium]|nr:hypothetical protein [Oscillospiraceae bacterium]